MRLVAALLLAASLSASQEGGTSLERGEKLLAQGQYAKAEIELRRAVEEDPASARAHGNLALALLQQRRTQQAVDEGRLAAAFGPESPEARYIYGLALRSAGRPLEAAREFEHAIAMKPAERGPAEALAQAYAAAEDERAVPAYEKLIRLEPDRPAPRAELAELLWSTGRAERGNDVADVARRLFPDSPDLHARYGRALFQQERFVDASTQLYRARELGSRDAPTFQLLANALWQAGRLEEARAAFEEGVGDHPGDAGLSRDLGRLLLSLGDAEKALEHLEEAARLRADDAGARFDVGRAREALGRLPSAEEAYRQAIALAPGLSSPRYALGRLLVREGRREEGEKELAVYRGLYDRAAKQTEEINARGAEIALGWAELARGDAAGALARFDSLPGSTETLLGRAAALSRLKRHREAVRALERAQELDPESRRIQALLAAERARAEERP